VSGFLLFSTARLQTGKGYRAAAHSAVHGVESLLSVLVSALFHLSSQSARTSPCSYQTHAIRSPFHADHGTIRN